MRVTFRKRVSILLLLVMMVPSSLLQGQSTYDEPAPEPEKEGDKKWRFSVGLVRQWGLKMKIEGPSATLIRRHWGSLPGQSGRTIDQSTEGFHPSVADAVIPYDDITQYADRTFDDGFVWIDIWTEDPFQPAERIGTTWNWSYDSLSQYDDTALTLSFHRTTSVSDSGTGSDRLEYTDYRSTRTVDYDNGVSAEEEFVQDGIQATALRRLRRGERWDWDLSLNVAWFPEETLEASDTPFSMQVRQDMYRGVDVQNYAYSYEATYRETYVYDDRFGRLDPQLESIPVVAPPPYAGGGFNGPGPLIPNLPEDYSVETLSFSSSETSLGSSESYTRVGSRYWTVQDQVDVEAEMDRMRLSCGLTATRHATNRLHIALEPKITLNVIEVDAIRHETVVATEQSSGTSSVLAEDVGEGSESSVIPGIMLAGSINYRFTKRWYVGGELGYEWLLEPVEINIDPDIITITLDGLDGYIYVGRWF